MKKTIIACCCKTCGNCTKAPTYDNRENCCCPDCGHCFKTPRVVYQYWPYYTSYPQTSWLQPCIGSTTISYACNNTSNLDQTGLLDQVRADQIAEQNRYNGDDYPRYRYDEQLQLAGDN